MVGTSQTTVFEIANSGRFSGTAPSSPSHSTVYAKAIFDDHGNSRSLTLTMSVLSGLLPTGAYASDWYFNSIKAPFTHISYVSGDHANSVDNGTNSFKADTTGGNFDFAFHFSNHNHDISGGETSVYSLTDLGLTADSFRSASVPSFSENDGHNNEHYQHLVWGNSLVWSTSRVMVWCMTMIVANLPGSRVTNLSHIFQKPRPTPCSKQDLVWWGPFFVVAGELNSTGLKKLAGLSKECCTNLAPFRQVVKVEKGCCIQYSFTSNVSPVEITECWDHTKRIHMPHQPG